MRLRFFLATVLGVALACAVASAQVPDAAARPQTPPDRVTVEELKSLSAAGKVLVLDVRYQIDRKIKGSTHVPLGEVETRLAELPRDREIVTYCS